MQIPFLSRLQTLVAPTLAPADAPERSKASATLSALRAALPELLAAAIVDIERGTVLAAHSNVPELVPAKAAPYYAEVVRQKRRAVKALRLSDEKIEDILVTLRRQLHLLRVSHDGRQLLYLIVDGHDTNLAVARAILREHSL